MQDQPPKPLAGLLVVSLEQAVAAPMATLRLAEAGARVIKVERPEGDFARGYDRAANGEASYFVWLNQGKESVALDLKAPGDMAVMRRMLARADVFVQNLAHGAAARLGLGAAELRAKDPRLVCCDISGFGPDGPYAARKAYDLLIQAESGVVEVSGGPGSAGGSASRSPISARGSRPSARFPPPSCGRPGSGPARMSRSRSSTCWRSG